MNLLRKSWQNDKHKTRKTIPNREDELMGCMWAVYLLVLCIVLCIVIGTCEFIYYTVKWKRKMTNKDKAMLTNKIETK